MRRRPLPKPGDRINCDPNRDDPSCPWRWTNVNRCSGIVVAVIDDKATRRKLIVYRVWFRSKQCWRYFIEDEWWWHMSTQWAIGPLPMPPKRTAEAPC